MKDSWTMRHFIGLILGLVLAAAVFFGGGWGAEHVSALAGHSVGLPSRTGLIGLATMRHPVKRALRDTLVPAVTALPTVQAHCARRLSQTS